MPDSVSTPSLSEYAVQQKCFLPHYREEIGKDVLGNRVDIIQESNVFSITNTAGHEVLKLLQGFLLNLPQIIMLSLQFQPHIWHCASRCMWFLLLLYRSGSIKCKASPINSFPFSVGSTSFVSTPVAALPFLTTEVDIPACVLKRKSNRKASTVFLPSLPIMPTQV